MEGENWNRRNRGPGICGDDCDCDLKIFEQYLVVVEGKNSVPEGF